MVTRLHLLSAAALLVAASTLAVSASAQELNTQPPAAPANLSYIEGTVDVVLEGVTERADPPTLLLDGDIVRTRNGRAEVVFADGTTVHVSHDAEIELLGPEHLRLLSGRISIRLSHAVARPYVVDTPASSVRMDAQGEYGITTDRAGRLEVTVARGHATVGDDINRVNVRGGERVTLLAAGGRPVLQRYNAARFDAFAQWAYERANGFSTAHSAQQLPYELRPYGSTLDQYGRWDYVAPHGYVWFPSVSLAWRPYYDGSWSFTRYGWTWHGRERWAWPTHHFGRWGFSGSSWYWIPANVWGPAWVSWGFAPGYVSWSPLGWDGRPAIRFTERPDHPAYAPDYNPWRGWTVVPRDHFRPRGNVRAHAVDAERLDAATRRTIVVQNSIPERARDAAVPRESVVAPGARGNVRRPPSAGVPAYAPVPPVSPATREGETSPTLEGRGAVRQGGTRSVTPDSDRQVPQLGSRRAPRADQPDASEPRAVEPRAGVPSAIAPRDGDSRRSEPRAEPRPAPRSEPRNGPPTQGAPPPERGGAVERGGSRRAPSVGMPSTAPPPGEAAASGGGAARRRPPS